MKILSRISRYEVSTNVTSNDVTNVLLDILKIFVKHIVKHVGRKAENLQSSAKIFTVGIYSCVSISLVKVARKFLGRRMEKNKIKKAAR